MMLIVCKGKLKDMKLYDSSDFKVIAPRKSCFFCKHCTDILWDYTNGPYMFFGDVCEGDWNECGKFEKEEDMGKYERYQLEWMIAHGHSIRELVGELYKLQYAEPRNTVRTSTPVLELYQEWLDNNGFGGELWACEKEWRETEGKNVGDLA